MSDTNESTETPQETATPNPEPAPRTLNPEGVREVLEACRAHESAEEAIEALNTLLPHLAAPELVREWRDTSDVVIEKAVALETPSGALHAHMTVFLVNLVGRGLVGEEMAWADAKFLQWMRHPKSFGPGHDTPREFQKPEMVQWLADLVGWQKVDLSKDRQAVMRFLSWVNSWAATQKRKVLRTMDTLRRMHHDPGLWNTVGFKK